MHRFNKLILPCIPLLIFLLACHKDEMASTPVSSAQIEIDITSGVPSPKWELAPSEVAELEQALDNLSPEEFSSFFDGLGYRGFVIRLTSPPRFIRVQNGYVLVEQGGVETTYVDSENQLEKWLLSISKPHIEPQLYSLLEENIGE
jgi:hypothetical protein